MMMREGQQRGRVCRAFLCGFLSGGIVYDFWWSFLWVGGDGLQRLCKKMRELGSMLDVRGLFVVFFVCVCV